MPQWSFGYGGASSATLGSIALLRAASVGDADRIRDALGGLEPVNNAYQHNDVIGRGWERAVAAWAGKPFPDGTRPLHLAASGGHLEAARVLLVAGADPDRVTWRDPIRTPLMIAAERDDVQMVRLLLDWGATVSVPFHVEREQGRYFRHWKKADARDMTGNPELQRLLESAADEQAASAAERDVVASPQVRSIPEWTPAQEEASRLWRTSDQIKSSDERQRVRELAAWLDPFGRATEEVSKDWGVEALRAGDVTRAEYLLQREALGHPMRRAFSGWNEFLARIDGIPGGDRLAGLLQARMADEAVDAGLWNQRHPAAVASRRNHREADLRYKGALGLRFLVLGGSAAALIALVMRIVGAASRV